MCKKILVLGLILLSGYAFMAHQNDKVNRKYFMPLIKFKELVVDDNLSGRDLDIKIRSKIWLHHVNNPQRLEKYFNDYDGFEMDVFYNAERKHFVVDHNDVNGNVSLDDMFANLPDISKKFFLLDMKNLDYNNKDDALKELLAVTGRNILHKSQIIVESENPEYLENFAENGFLTSFYFPSLSRVKKQDIRKVLEAATDRYKKSTVDFISGDVRHFNFMDYYFPDAPKIYLNTRRNAKVINSIVLKHSHTKVILNQDTRFFYE